MSKKKKRSRADLGHRSPARILEPWRDQHGLSKKVFYIEAYRKRKVEKAKSHLAEIELCVRKHGMLDSETTKAIRRFVEFLRSLVLSEDVGWLSFVLPEKLIGLATAISELHIPVYDKAYNDIVFQTILSWMWRNGKEEQWADAIHPARGT